MKKQKTPEELDEMIERAEEALDWIESHTAPYRGTSEEGLERAYSIVQDTLFAFTVHLRDMMREKMRQAKHERMFSRV